jgi:hypothetical protein
MDGPVVASLISSSVAVLVAVGSAIRADLQRAADRRYERRRMFLMDVQDSALALRGALRDYGDALRRIGDPTHRADGDRLRRALAMAGGRLDVAGSRLDDDAVIAALSRWEHLARETLIATPQGEAPQENAAFLELNRAVSSALRSTHGLARR